MNNVGSSELADCDSSNGCGCEAIIADPPNPPTNLQTDENADTLRTMSFTWEKPTPTSQRPDVLWCTVYEYNTDLRLEPDIINRVTTSFTTDPGTFVLRKGYEESFETTCTNIIGESYRSDFIKIRSSGPPKSPFDL